MKKLIIFVFILLIPGAVSIHAQNRITGTVMDKATDTPIVYATVNLLHADSTVVTGTVSDEKGRFILDNLTDGNYLLQVSYLGYEKEYLSVRIPEQSDLGKIILSQNAQLLNAVVVSARKPFVVQKADRYIVNVGDHIQTGGRNALEVLSNTPGVSVTSDGITVMGAGVVIYIDGRPTNLSGEQLRSMLSSMQGENVERIEVITNPSSRYDASGGSIIDIRMKKGAQYGINGSTNMSYRQGKTDRESVGLNLNYREEKINLFGNYSLNRAVVWERLVQENRMDVNGVSHSFVQNTDVKSIDPIYSQQYKFGADYFINDKNTVGFLFSGYHTGDGKIAIPGRTTITPDLAGIAFSSSDGTKNNGDDGKQFNLNYQVLFSKPGQKLNVDVDYAQFTSAESQSNRNVYFDLSGNENGTIEQLRHSNPQKIGVWSLKADYAQPLWKGSQMEFGAKASQSHTDNNLLYEIFNNSDWQIDPKQTNRFAYTEQIHAAYVSLNQSLGKWLFQVGLRSEYTYSKSDQRTISVATDSTYIHFFPTLYINYSPSKIHNFGFSYGRRIQRPAYESLNPFEFRIDAYSFLAGNPRLRPVIRDNFSLAYTFNHSLTARLIHNRNKDLIIQTPIQDKTENRYGLTFTNFGKYLQSGLMVNYRKAVTPWWTADATLLGLFFQNSSKDSYGEINEFSFGGTAQLNNSFKITPNLSAELNGMYYSGLKQGYLSVKPRGNVSLGMRQALLKNKLSLALTMNDLFHNFVTDISSRNSGMDYRLKVNDDSRWVSLSVRYTFGSDKVKSSRTRTTGLEEERDRVKN